MSTDKTLLAINAVSAILDLLAQYNVSAQKLIDLRQASGGTLTQDDLRKLSEDAQAAIDSIE